MATLGAGLQNGAICCERMSTHLCGWANDKVYFCSSSATDLEREVLDGTNTLLEVCDYVVTGGADAPRTSIVVPDDGGIIVCVDGGGEMNLYRCRSFKDGFSLIGA
jgi:hypothetical protein